MPGRGSLTAALALALLAAACAGESSPEDAAENEAGASGNAALPLRTPSDGNAADPPASEAMTEEADDPGLAAMRPHQRRAYDRGFRDCCAGRYEPHRYPEAYRIGCAAAYDESDGGR